MCLNWPEGWLSAAGRSSSLNRRRRRPTSKLRIWSVGGANAVVKAESIDIDKGLQYTATLAEGKVSAEKANTPENLDRSVYRSLGSTEYFVFSQEHYEKQFFESMIDLDAPGLDRVKAAYTAHKPVLALYELVEYYRRKTVPADLIRKPVEHPAAATDPAAEDICRHLFKDGAHTVDMGPVIQWNRHPVEVKEWLWNFNNHAHFVQLLEAYLATRNEKYTDEFAAQISDWIVENPAPPYSLTRVATWRNLEAGGRCSRAWPASFYGFLSSPRFTPQAHATNVGLAVESRRLPAQTSRGACASRTTGASWIRRVWPRSRRIGPNSRAPMNGARWATNALTNQLRMQGLSRRRPVRTRALVPQQMPERLRPRVSARGVEQDRAPSGIRAAPRVDVRLPDVDHETQRVLPHSQRFRRARRSPNPRVCRGAVPTRRFSICGNQGRAWGTRRPASRMSCRMPGISRCVQVGTPTLSTCSLTAGHWVYRTRTKTSWRSNSRRTDGIFSSIRGLITTPTTRGACTS